MNLKDKVHIAKLFINNNSLINLIFYILQIMQSLILRGTSKVCLNGLVNSQYTRLSHLEVLLLNEL